MRVIKTNQSVDVPKLVEAMQRVTQEAETTIVDALLVGEVEATGALMFVLVQEYQGARVCIPRIITQALLAELSNI